jgi:hypothetical protein
VIVYYESIKREPKIRGIRTHIYIVSVSLALKVRNLFKVLLKVMVAVLLAGAL